MGSLIDYAKLVRPYGLLFLGLTPFFGAVCNGENSSTRLFLLVLTGFLIHVFTFVQNDYFDLEVDKKSAYVSDRPLVTGKIKKETALYIVIFSFILSIIINTLFMFTLISFIMLLVSFFLITLYNMYSKRVACMEYILAIGVFTTGLFGAYSASNEVSGLAIIISLVNMMQWVFSVGVFANLKDVKYDTKIGVMTIPTLFGVKVIDDEFSIPFLFVGYAFFIKTLHILVAFLPFLLMYTEIFVFDMPIPFLVFIFLSTVILYLLAKIFSTPLSQRDRMLVYEGLQEGLSLLLIPMVLMSYLFKNIGIAQTLLIITVIIIWPLSSLRIVFGKKLIPLE
ncbi:MAG: UbiA family prenyltransferase [Candidatus Thermoplasmatota archaeon]|nr:UbiA family prenyltransferase [Candidatus Thermoplasmatota archaeon]